MGEKQAWLAVVVVLAMAGGAALLSLTGAGSPTDGRTGPSAPAASTSAPQAGDAPPAPPTPAADAGVPEGINLRPSGDVTISRSGTVVEGLDVTGRVIIDADDVTIRNTRVASDTRLYVIHVRPGVTGALIEHVEVDNMGSNGKGIYFDAAGGTVRLTEVHSAEDGIAITADDVTIEDSYVHSLARTPTSHNDAIQIRRGNNITIRGNNLQAYNPDTDDPMNAAIQIGSLHGDEPIRNLLVTGNLMNGGNVTVNGGGRGEVADAVFSHNRFGRDYRFGVAGNLENSRWERNNVFDDNGEFAG